MARAPWRRRDASGAAADPLAPYRVGPLDRSLRKACHLQEAVAATRSIEGDIVECGVAAAWSLAVITHAVRRSGDARRIIAVDSYEGFPATSAQDVEWFDPTTMKPHYRLFDIEFARTNLRGSGLEEHEVESVTFVKGWIPEALEEVSEPISLLHLDVDLYNPYRDALERLWPQVVEGGWVLFDEYDQGRDEEKWPGAKRAIDEFLDAKGIPLQRHWSGFAHVIKGVPA